MVSFLFSPMHLETDKERVRRDGRAPRARGVFTHIPVRPWSHPRMTCAPSPQPPGEATAEQAATTNSPRTSEQRMSRCGNGDRLRTIGKKRGGAPDPGGSP
jgi:hypothetical protein